MGTVQTPGKIIGTSGQSLCFSPCSVHFISFPSIISFQLESSVQYFERCSPTSTAKSRVSVLKNKKIYYSRLFGHVRRPCSDTLAVSAIQTACKIKNTTNTLLSCLNSLIIEIDIIPGKLLGYSKWDCVKS